MLRLSLYPKKAFCVLNVLVKNMSDSAEKITPRLKPSKWDKRMLVWTKNFKSIEEVPQYVQPELIERARSQARIKISNRAMILTALASLLAIISGKAAAKRGESVHQQNLDWHKQYQDEHNQKESLKEKPS